jgi:hypothetical protein
MSRSFPKPKQLTVGAAKLLRKALRERSVPGDLSDDATRLCYKMGWLYLEDPKISKLEDPGTICFLPTKLHEKYSSICAINIGVLILMHILTRYIEYTLGGNCGTTLPSPWMMFPNLVSLCEAVLREFSRKRLLSSPSKTIAPYYRPVEAAFHDEWYRAFCSLFSPGVGISSEWVRAGDGRIDFKILEPGWGVELLQDGNQLAERCGRFEEGGAYHKWIAKGEIRDWLILDFRHTEPESYGMARQPVRGLTPCINRIIRCAWHKALDSGFPRRLPVCICPRCEQFREKVKVSSIGLIVLVRLF